MPQGPGDDILDELDKGTKDDVILSKYKVNTDQLRAFKSLHYGLSNQKMAYQEIEDYFPELNTYFKGGEKPAPALPGIERPDFTKPVKEKALRESTAPSTAAVKQLAEADRPVQTMAMKFADKAKKADRVAKKTLLENDDVVENLIREGRYSQEQQKKLNEIAAGPRTDMPAAQALALQRQMALEPETKVQDMPVSKEEVAQSKNEIQSNEQQARHFLKQVAIKKPEQARDIQSSIYMLDAAERLKQNPEAGNKVHENLGKMEKRELEYDPTTGRVIRREGFFDSIVTGVKERTRQMTDYDTFQQPKEKVVEIMEERIKNYDPDEPVPMPTGAGEIGQMTGMEWKSLATGAAVGATVGRISPVAAQAVNAALSAPEYYKRGYSSAFEQTYRQLRAEGKQPDEAYDIAIKQANSEGKLSAAEGAISSAIGSRIGLKPLPKFNITGGFKNAATQVLKKTAHYAGETSIEGLADGLVAGYLQEQKNIAAKENKVFRSEGNEIFENVKGELTFALAMGAATKAGSALVDPKTYNKLLYHLAKQPKETVEAKVGEMVMDGQIKEDDAKEALLKIEEQRKIDEKIPENIKEVSRQAMADKIMRRQELEKEIEANDEALHPPIKEEIKKLNEEILEHSKHVKPEDQAEEAEASEQPEEPVASSQEQIPGAEQTMGSEGTVPGINEQDDGGNQEYVIETEEDLDKALQNAVQRPKPAADNSGALPKLAGEQETQTQGKPIEADSTTYTPQSIIQKARETFKGDPLIERVTNFLEPLIEANPNIRIDTAAEIPGNVYGLSHSDGKIDLNTAIHSDEGALLKTGLHEMMHAVTRNEIENNAAFRGELDEMLGKLRDKFELPSSDSGVTTAISLLSATGKLNENLYGAANAHEMIAELFTNKNFRDELASINYEGDSLLKKFFLLIAKYLSQKYNQLVGAKSQISADNIADYLMELTEKTISGRQGADVAGALPLAAPKTQEQAIIDIIKATPNSISDEKLNERIVAATGMDEAAVQSLIDSVRKPPIIPPPSQQTDDLSPQQRNVSLNKFNRLFDKAPVKKPNWFIRQWESLKNMSAWTDNPYRFVTKITEDINKQYGINNRGPIPLGRMFEKSSAGRAALKIESFVSEVIGGKIGDSNYGRLRGQKYMDFQRYLAARRVIDRLDQQESKREAGEQSMRQTGNITRQDAEVQLQELEQKYGNLDEFNARAEAFQEHMDTMLLNLVASGILSKEAYDQIKAENDFYAPFSVVQSKFLADQDKRAAGISGIVKRIKGIDYVLPTTEAKAITEINDLGDALRSNQISPEDYFNSAVQILQDARDNGAITEPVYNRMLAGLENPGFAINDILDAAANMIYKAEGMALKNRMMQRLFAYKEYDTDGLFIQDVDGFELKTLPDGSTVSVPKPLSSIKAEPGMAPIKLRLDGKDQFVAVNERAARKLTDMSNYEVATWMKAADFLNKVFRTFVITLSPGFQVVNFAIDFARSAMLNRYGPITGKGLVQPIVNAALFAPQYVEALLHSALGNLGVKTEAYKQWMESDSFSKGMFDNLFDNEKRIKEVTQPLAKRLLTNFLKLKFIDIPGSILEQTHKLATFQRGLSVEGFKPEMFTAMLGTVINQNFNPDMSREEMNDALDKINYEVQNISGSPNFPQTHRWMKVASIFLQFLSARVKGEMTDYRRIANLFTGRGEGVKLSRQETIHVALQFLSAAGALAYYAIRNNLDDDDEKEFDKIPPYHQDNYMNIPAGSFEYKDENGHKQILRDYIKVPLRGLTATMNVMSNSFVKFYKRKNPQEFKKMAEAFLGNASPINLSGKNERELGESSVSNLTPVFKFFIEYSFNRDTHSHRDLIPDTHGYRSMLQQYSRGDIKPWDVYTDKTPEWAKEMSKWLFEELGIEINAITLDHMENTMGNPTELYDKAIEKRLRRSKMKYPVYTPKTPQGPQRSAEVKPVTE